MAAEVLAGAGLRVTVYERMPSVARKFLLAGRGGLNLTHSEPLPTFLTRYGEASQVLGPAIGAFSPDDLGSWCAGLGQVPFVGSSGRVFPAAMRASALLRAWQERLSELEVEIRVGHEWLGWIPEDVMSQRFRVATTGGGEGAPGSGGDEIVESADVTLLCLGGASWPKTGSNGAWVGPLASHGVAVNPLRAANSGFDVHWSPVFAERFAGVPVKNVAVSVAGSVPVRGELMVVDDGVEGGAIYAVGSELRAQLDAHGSAELTVDLRPDLTHGQIVERLGRRRPKDSVSKVLERSVGLAPVTIGLLRESCDNHLPEEPDALATLIAATPIRIASVQPIDRAISTAGGIRLDEIDKSFMLRSAPGVFVAGEMLDWDAPTGGYLLQATFSTAVAAARGAIAWLD